MLRKRIQTRMLGALIAVAVALTLAGSAAAGTFGINSCGLTPHGTQGWTNDETAGWSGGLPYFYDGLNCSSYGFYRRFEINGVPGGAYSAWTFTAPPGTYLDSASLYQSLTPNTPGAYDAIYAELEDGSRRTVANYVYGSGTVGTETYQMPTASSHPIRLRTELGCQASVSSCAGTGAGNSYSNEWQLTGTHFQLIDPSLPAFATASGDGWKAEPADGVAPIAYATTDQGSGVQDVRFLVDGVEFGRHTKDCTVGAYTPCPLSTDGQFMLDTTRLSEGQHTVALVASDWSNNVTAAADKQLTITVRRAPQPAGLAPVTTTDPSANGGGSPAVGDHLNGNAGSWSGSGVTYTYQWQRCDAQGQNCVAIAGATGLGYTATTADVGSTLEFCVTATNSGGSTTSCSAPTPAVIGSRTTSSGSDRSGDALPTSVGGPAPTPAPSRSTSTTTSAGVDRGAPNGSGASDRVVLSALANSRTSTQKVRFGKRVPITGRLVGPNGTPIGGAVLTVQVQTAMPGASMSDAAQVVTGSDGRFKYTAPAGPSRVIRFAYRAYTADTAFADTTDVRLLVSAGVTLKATPTKVRNKHATVFTGRLLGKPISKRGVVVDLQVYFRKQWRTFAAPRTNRAGAFKFKYRFMAGAATWKFRARVRRESSYPFELGYSGRLVKVKVTN